MNVFDIVKYPSNVLHLQCEPVNDITEDLRKTLDRMLYTMKERNGIGLAAPQVGILKRFVVIGLPEQAPIKMINPTIISHSSDKITFNEGCLSLPGVFADVSRYAEIDVEYTDENGNSITRHADDLLAICMQHEIDHLDGKMYIDRLSPLKRNLLIKKYEKISKQNMERN